MAGWFACLTASPDASAAGETVCPTFLILSAGKQHRLPDGSVIKRYHVAGARKDGCRILKDISLTAFCRMGMGRRAGKGYVRVPLTFNRGEIFLEIRSKAQTMVKIMVTGTCQERTYLAQTVDVLFGKAGPGIQAPAGAGHVLPPGLPVLGLRPSRRNYHMQTGMTYHFDYAPVGDGPGIATVFEDSIPVATIPLAADGRLAFTPDHDVRLDRAGSSTWKEAVIHIEEQTGGRRYITAHTLRLHRSITAHLLLLPGLTLLGLSAAGMALIVWWKRKNWSRQWSASCG